MLRTGAVKCAGDVHSQSMRHMPPAETPVRGRLRDIGAARTAANHRRAMYRPPRVVCIMAGMTLVLITVASLSRVADARGNFSCVTDAPTCSGHGSCVAATGRCDCSPDWDFDDFIPGDDDCLDPYPQVPGVQPWWDVVRVAAYVSHGPLTVWMLWTLYTRNKGRDYVADPITLRERVLALNLSAVILRMLWLIDPAGYFMFPSGVDALLLRTPQVLWLSGMMVTILIWDHLVKSVENRQPSARAPKIIAGLIAVLLLVAIPGTIIGATGTNLATEITNGVFGGYIIVMMIAGFQYGIKLRTLLVRHGRTHSIAHTLRFVRVVLIAAEVLALVLVLDLVSQALFNIHANTKPEAYLVFFGVVHMFCECSFGWLMFVASGYTPSRRSMSEDARRRASAERRKSSRHVARFNPAVGLKGPTDGTNGADDGGKDDEATAGGVIVTVEEYS